MPGQAFYTSQGVYYSPPLVTMPGPQSSHPAYAQAMPGLYAGSPVQAPPPQLPSMGRPTHRPGAPSTSSASDAYAPVPSVSSSYVAPPPPTGQSWQRQTHDHHHQHGAIGQQASASAFGGSANGGSGSGPFGGQQPVLRTVPGAETIRPGMPLGAAATSANWRAG